MIQKNEGMNLAVVRFASKTRCYSTSISLQNRVSITVGLHNGGYGKFWSSVFSELNIKITPNTAKYFHEKDESTGKKGEKDRTTEYKAQKGKKKMENLAEESKRTIKDAVRHVTYLAAGFMTGEEEIKQTDCQLGPVQTNGS